MAQLEAPEPHVNPHPLPAQLTRVDAAVDAAVAQPPPAQFTVQVLLPEHSVEQPPPSQVNVHVAPPLHLKLQLPLLSPPQAMSQLPSSQTQSLPAVHATSEGSAPHAVNAAIHNTPAHPITTTRFLVIDVAPLDPDVTVGYHTRSQTKAPVSTESHAHDPKHAAINAAVGTFANAPIRVADDLDAILKAMGVK